MKLSTKSRYAVRSLIDIALFGKNKPLSVIEISSREDISERYLELIFAKLKKAGFITSSRGSHGGYSLAKDPNEITMQDIINVMELSSSIVDDQDTTDPLKQILYNEIWAPIDEKLDNYLSNITLQDLIKD